ncbi:MAG: hypothetical protein IPM97_04610 [Bdellovibrionaceae bacterium]|nr:hypothetical protein [Pseudobdellovibrionaceae bacterium]
MAKSILRVPRVGEVDVYEEISQSLYPAREKYSFASIPGVVAFLYYPGKLWFVFVGMLLVGLIIVASDTVVYKVFGNAFLSAQVSFYLANSFSQFGPES